MANYVEVWGDTVSPKHLVGAIAISVGIALPVFLLASNLLADNETLGRSYALLAGLAACLGSAVISARLFKPKRIVTETVATNESRRHALASIVADGGHITDPATLNEKTRLEMEQLGLTELFQEAWEHQQVHGDLAAWLNADASIDNVAHSEMVNADPEADRQAEDIEGVEKS